MTESVAMELKEAKQAKTAGEPKRRVYFIHMMRQPTSGSK